MRTWKFLYWTFWSLSVVHLLLFLGCTTVTSPPSITKPPEETQASPRLEFIVESNPPSTLPHLQPSSQLAPFSLEDRMLVSISNGKGDRQSTSGQHFTFRAQDMSLPDALVLFARANNLNVVAGPDIQGTITVDFQGLPLERAMAALLDAHGYYWEKQGKLIRVRRFETQTFTIEYIRLVRGGTGRNKAQFNSGTSGASQDAGEVTLSQKDDIKFWEELETQLKMLLSQEGRLVVNRLSGTIQVTDLRKRVQEIAQFISLRVFGAPSTVKSKLKRGFMKLPCVMTIVWGLTGTS